MAGSLNAQLAQIRIQGANPLDLKARKKTHSQSLIFSNQDAVDQDFDALFLICYEGFEELCRLDLRFTGFVSNIFSEQSKNEDRALMTASQNAQLDAVIDQFLPLISERLLLKPALKSIEWLVRRFRIHQYNTISTVLAFLPYHQNDIFTALLSILPSDLPPMLKFLNTYVQSRENPPRHVIVYTASHDALFFTALNARVVEASKSEHHSATLLTFWATIVIEAVLATKDQPCSVRRAVQMQSLEDLSTRIISSVSNGLILKKVPDLQVGCYMILIVLVTICPLKDNVLIALLERVTQNWATTQGPGLVCAAALAQHMNIISLSKPTLKSLLDIQDLTGELRRLKARYQVGNITLGILLGIAQDKKSQSVQRIGLAYSLIETGLLNSRHLSKAITAFLSASRDQHEDGNVALSIKNLLLHFAGEKSMKVVSQDVKKELDMEMIRPETKQPIHIPMASSLSHVSSGKSHSEDIQSLSASKSLDYVMSQIATESRNAISFFSNSSSNVFKILGIAFELNSTSSEKLRSGSEMAMLFKSAEKAQPSFLSFFMRFWCSSYTANSRATAINLVSRYIKMQKKTLDLQLILPYALYGLADSSLNVRRASVNLINLFNIIYEMDEKRELSNRDNTFREQIYGQIKSNNDTMWVSTEDANRFIRGILLPSLQDCLLDFHHIEKWLPNFLNMSKHSRSFQFRFPEFRKRFRQGIFTFLCSHAVNTPLYTVRHCLLRILNQIERVGSVSRTKLLLPLLIECDRQGQSKFEKQCNEEKVDPLQLLDLIVEIVLPTDIDGIKLLQRLLESKKWNDAPLLLNAIHKRIRHIWFKMKSDLQLSLANVLLKLAISDQDAGQGQTYNGESLNTLQSVQLSTTILQSFLESFSAFAINRERIFISKRRRTSNGHVAVVSPEAPIISELPIIRLSVILDLIEISKVERHPQLLKGLFQVLEDLQVYQSSFDTEMGYLQMNVMENILAIVKKAEKSPNSQLDHFAIRSNLLIDSIRSTSSVQVQQLGLSIVSALANISPEIILHNIMPLFTFMSSSIVHQNNEYSTSVLSQAIELVIPGLVESLRRRNEDLLQTMSELLLNFVVTFEYIPRPQRLALFKSLADKLGSEEFLFALLVILLDKYPNNATMLQFAAEIISKYDIRIQFLMIEKYLSVILDILKPKSMSSDSLVIDNVGFDAEHRVTNLLPFLTVILRSPSFVSKTQEILDQEEDFVRTIRVIYEQVAKQAFILSTNSEDNEMMRVLCIQFLDTLLDLLSVPNYVGVIGNLLARTEDDDDVRLQVLKLFEQRLKIKGFGPRSNHKLYIGFLSQLTYFMQHSRSLPIKCIVLTLMGRIVENVGKRDMDAAFSAAEIVSNERILGAREFDIRTAALLCLAKMVEVLSDKFTPFISASLPKAIDELNSSISESGHDSGLHYAAYSFICTLLSRLPWMITSTHLKRLFEFSYKSASLNNGRNVEPHECFEALDQCWEYAMAEGPAAVKEHIEVLHVATENSSVVIYSEQLIPILLKAFDLRRIHYTTRTPISFTDWEVAGIEEILFDSTITMIHKFSDHTFRPVFLRLWKWTSNSVADSAKIYRQITFYAFLAKFFNSLRSFVTRYAELVLEDTLQTLKHLQVNDDQQKLLWRKIVLALHTAFEHDQEGFWQSPARFSSVFESLLIQFQHASQISMKSEIVPAITELASAADSATQNKELNSALLQHMRSENPLIRLAAVQCQESLTSRLGEEWLTLLPEILPFIVELQEDNNETVEHETRKWVTKIEETLGESLNPMLQ